MSWCAVINNLTPEVVCFQLSIPAIDQRAANCNIQVHQTNHILGVHKRKVCLISVKNLSESFASFFRFVREFHCAAFFTVDKLEKS